MHSSLKFILIVFLFYCQHSSSYVLDPDRATSPQWNWIITTCIDGLILVAVLVLMGVVICLYFKMDQTLKALKALVCSALKNNLAMVTQDKVPMATSVNAGYYRNLRCCDEYNCDANFRPLLSCHCDQYKGL